MTAAGGAEAVIREKQWRDVGDVFNLPRTITSVSFVLKRGYMLFLWDYEQVRADPVLLVWFFCFFGLQYFFCFHPEN